jgi:hypothetical protein
MLLSLYALLHGAAPRLHAQFQPVEDFAADLLLVDQLHQDGYLLTGHYSRYGFNHPGPVFLYANALLEPLGPLLHLPRANTWLLAALLVNFAFLMLSSWSIARLFDRRFSLASIAVVLPMAALIGENLASAWMPNRLILPFAAFYLSILLVLAKGLRYLPLSTLLACLLIHGYISMPAATLPLLVGVSLLVLLRDGSRHGSPVRWLVLSLIIGGLFFLPILLDLLLHTDSNPLRVLRAQQALAGLEKARLAESLGYAQSYWNLSGTVLIPATLLWLAASPWSSPEQRRLLSRATLVGALVSTVFVLYHLHVPKPLYPFMGLYYLAVPLTLGCLLLQAALLAVPHTIARCAATLCLGVVGLLWLATLSMKAVESKGEISEIGDFLRERQGHPLALDYSANDETLWADAAGVLVYLKDHGVEACVARPELDYLFSRRAVCAADSAADVQLTRPASCAPGCLFATASLAIEHPPFSVAQQRVDYPACQLPRTESARAETDCAVLASQAGLATFGPYVQLPPGRYRLEIEYAANLPRNEQAGRWDIAVDRGQTILGNGSLAGTEGKQEVASAEFVNDRRHETEIRTYASPAGPVTIHRISLQRL